MKPKIWNDLTNILAKLCGSEDYDPRVKYDTSLEFYGNQIPVLPKPSVSDSGKTLNVKTDGTYELKNAVDMNSVHYTEDSGKTQAQKLQARNNIGAEQEKLIVNITFDDNAYTADKTYSEIEAAFVANRIVELWYEATEYQICYCEDGFISFFCIDIDDSGFYIRGFTCSADTPDLWNYMEYASSLFLRCPTIVTDTSSTSITLSKANKNTEYIYGELTALTITSIDGAGEFSIVFISGSTPTVLSTPNELIMPDDFTVEANTRYEINVKNSYAVIGSWAVSAR